MPTIRNILVPTDFSGTATDALERAAAMAIRYGARVHLLHAFTGTGAVDPVESERHAATVKTVVDTVVGRWPDGTPAPPATDLITSRSPTVFGAIMRAVTDHDIDLVVMGTHGGGLLDEGIAERVVRYATCSVLVLRRPAHGHWPEQPGSILVAVDFSESSRRALDYAVQLAKPPNRLAVIHVVATPEHPSVYAERVHSPFHNHAELQDHVEAELRKWVGDRAEEFIVTEGDISLTLVSACRDYAAHLVVVGAHGTGEQSRLPLGSVAQRLSRTSPSPVLTVR